MTRRGRLLESFAESLAHPLSYIGAVLALLSGALIIILIVLDLSGFYANPYIGVLTYLILPAAFLLGLILIPLGTMRARRRRARGEEDIYPVLDLNEPRQRRRFLLIGIITAVNVVVFASAAYRGVEFMDSPTFCGRTCHTVMKPEFTAYRFSPHAQVRCVDCHIGRGAGWYVRSKLSGVRQVFAVAFNTYSKPIPTPVENLRPAPETCGECHWPEKFHGDRIRVKTHYQEDEANTPLYTILVLKVGGGNPESGFSRGIHWHVANEVAYTASEDRETIYNVSVRDDDGTVRDFTKAGFEAGTAAAESLEMRVMDCVDCHNRPTHIYQMPEDAVDSAILAETIDRSLPYVRREAVRVLRQDYADEAAAAAAIPESLRAFYAREFPDVLADRGGAVDAAAREVVAIWKRNIFPEMEVNWGSYPDHIGHRNFPGCFRCHDEEHATADGATITQSCDNCHTLLAVEEESPAILDQIFPAAE